MKKVSFILNVAVITTMMIIGCGDSLYSQVKIGNQVWMTENLNVEKFRNGDPIPHANTFAKWRKTGQDGQPAWCYYNNNPENGDKYGKLYNWYAVNDLRGLCPKGWHVPSDDEWKLLSNFLGGSKVAAKKMKSTSGWDKSGNNESGFTAIPVVGLSTRDEYDYEFGGLGSAAIWWSNTESDKDNVWYQYLSNEECGVAQDIKKSYGLTVRCVKD